LSRFSLATFARVLGFLGSLRRTGVGDGSAAEAARRLGLTEARLTQILDLTLLAPDLQEEILLFPAINGVEPLKERVLRGIVRAPWADQRLRFKTER